MKYTSRTFIESEEVYRFMQERGLTMVAGDESKYMESDSYYGMDFMLRFINSGFSKGKLEIIRIKDLPKELKLYFKEHLLERFKEE